MSIYDIMDEKRKSTNKYLDTVSKIVSISNELVKFLEANNMMREKGCKLRDLLSTVMRVRNEFIDGYNILQGELQECDSHTRELASVKEVVVELNEKIDKQKVEIRILKRNIVQQREEKAELMGKINKQSARSDVYANATLVALEDLQYFDMVVAPSQDTILQDDELRAIIVKQLNTLTEREATCIKLYFGIGASDDGITYDEIGELLNCSGPRVMQILAKAFRKLRHPRRTKKLDAYRPVKN